MIVFTRHAIVATATGQNHRRPARNGLRRRAPGVDHRPGSATGGAASQRDAATIGETNVLSIAITLHQRETTVSRPNR